MCVLVLLVTSMELTRCCRNFERVLGIKSGEVTKDGQFSIESLRCLGACSLAPVVTINEKIYGGVQPENVQKILEQYLVKVDRKDEIKHAQD